jgi:hypothetical protein
MPYEEEDTCHMRRRIHVGLVVPAYEGIPYMRRRIHVI